MSFAATASEGPGPVTLILGLGNPIVSDDAVGPRVATALAAELGEVPGLCVRELHAGGLALMEALVGHAHAVLVDAMVTGARPGTVRVLAPDDLRGTRNLGCSHDAGLAEALAVGRAVGLELPRLLRIWGVEAADVRTVGDRLTPAVARAVPRVVAQIQAYLAASRGSGHARRG